MKTTIDISDQLLKKAKGLAVKRRSNLRAIIEQGIRNTLKEQLHGGKYVLPDMSIGGKGLHPEYRNKAWSDFRDVSYEGRGT